MTLTTRDELRLEIGDTDVADALFSDDELDVFLTRRAIVTTAGTAFDVVRSAADACDALATRFARQFDFASDGQSFALSQRAANYRLQAQQLRQRAGGSSVTVKSSVAAAVEDNLNLGI